MQCNVKTQMAMTNVMQRNTHLMRCQHLAHTNAQACHPKLKPLGLSDRQRGKLHADLHKVCVAMIWTLSPENLPSGFPTT